MIILVKVHLMQYLRHNILKCYLLFIWNWNWNLTELSAHILLASDAFSREFEPLRCLHYFPGTFIWKILLRSLLVFPLFPFQIFPHAVDILPNPVPDFGEFFEHLHLLIVQFGIGENKRTPGKIFPCNIPMFCN